MVAHCPRISVTTVARGIRSGRISLFCGLSAPTAAMKVPGREAVRAKLPAPRMQTERLGDGIDVLAERHQAFDVAARLLRSPRLNATAMLPWHPRVAVQRCI